MAPEVKAGGDACSDPLFPLLHNSAGGYRGRLPACEQKVALLLLAIYYFSVTLDLFVVVIVRFAVAESGVRDAKGGCIQSADKNA